ncbi:hypothetical protein TrVE_jg11535 [Triparma verrucosa]|uniref:Uncharacterized protein n=1 Tax=Triparma verrucosa TaxID=1606542 RepID=A0A9W7ESS5_9STRA|nr:hypothetical protein TrVE_jg11535 [Triparma verrucosa]
MPAVTSTISLENVDLFHTKLQELGKEAFLECSELKSMTIPDSLQTIGNDVFIYCSKLIPSHIDVNHYHGEEEAVNGGNATSEVISHLCSLQTN